MPLSNLLLQSQYTHGVYSGLPLDHTLSGLNTEGVRKVFYQNSTPIKYFALDGGGVTLEMWPCFRDRVSIASYILELRHSI